MSIGICTCRIVALPDLSSGNGLVVSLFSTSFVVARGVYISTFHQCNSNLNTQKNEKHGMHSPRDGLLDFKLPQLENGFEHSLICCMVACLATKSRQSL